MNCKVQATVWSWHCGCETSTHEQQEASVSDPLPFQGCWSTCDLSHCLPSCSSTSPAHLISESDQAAAFPEL